MRWGSRTSYAVGLLDIFATLRKNQADIHSSGAEKIGAAAPTLPQEFRKYATPFRTPGNREAGQEQTRAMGSDRAKNARGMGAAGVAKAACGGVGPSKRCGYPSDGLGQADGVQRGHGAAGCA